MSTLCQSTFILLINIISHISCAQREYVLELLSSSYTRNWPDSNDLCASRYGTELATILTPQDRASLVSYAHDAGNYVWIGLTDQVTEGDWKWVDDTPCTLTNGDCSELWSNAPDDIGDGMGETGADCGYWDTNYGTGTGTLGEAACTNVIISGGYLCNANACNMAIDGTTECTATSNCAANQRCNDRSNTGTLIPLDGSTQCAQYCTCYCLDIQTTEPTSNPSGYPSLAPTLIPSFMPSSNPSNHPTSSPIFTTTTYPSIDPTYDPTSDPTKDPSNDPTKNPSNDPTKNPSNDPTKNPVTAAPTTQPITSIPTTLAPSLSSISVTDLTAVTLTGTDSVDINRAVVIDFNVDSKYVIIFPYLVAVIDGVITLLGIAGYIHSTYVHINDFFKVQAFFATLLQVLDLLSDVFLALHISLLIAAEQFFFILFIYSITCIVVPIAVSVLQLSHQIRKYWRRHASMKLWLSENSTLLYFLSIFTGSSFTAIHLLNSNLFSLDSFSMGLTNAQFHRYQTEKIFSIVLLQNIPQLIVQSLFLLKIRQFNKIAISSMVFSSISIVVAIVSMITAKQILNGSGYVIIEFEVTASSVVQKSNAYKTQVSKIRSQISAVLGLNQEKMVEVMKPTIIPNGLKLKMHIRLNGAQRNINYKMLLDKFQQSGQLAQIIQNSWKLKTVPVCSQIVFTVVDQSKNRKTNTVSVKVDSDSDFIINKNIQLSKVMIGSVDSIDLKPMPMVRPLHSIPTKGGSGSYSESEDDGNELIYEVEGDYKDMDMGNIPIGNGGIEILNQTAANMDKEDVIVNQNVVYVYNMNEKSDNIIIGDDEVTLWQN